MARWVGPLLENTAKGGTLDRTTYMYRGNTHASPRRDHAPSDVTDTPGPSTQSDTRRTCRDLLGGRRCVRTTTSVLWIRCRVSRSEFHLSEETERARASHHLMCVQAPATRGTPRPWAQGRVRSRDRTGGGTRLALEPGDGCSWTTTGRPLDNTDADTSQRPASDAVIRWTGEQGDDGDGEAHVKNGKKRSRSLRGRNTGAAPASHSPVVRADQTPRRVSVGARPGPHPIVR